MTEEQRRLLDELRRLPGSPDAVSEERRRRFAGFEPVVALSGRPAVASQPPDFVSSLDPGDRLFHSAFIVCPRTSDSAAIEVGRVMLSRDDGLLHLGRLDILPEVRGKGLEGAALFLLVSGARRAGCSVITADVRPDEPRWLASLRRLYRSAGFTLDDRDRARLTLG